MKIVIDEKACLKHKLTLDEFLVLLMHGHVKKPDEVFQNLINREILVRKDGKLYITHHWADVVDEILCDSSTPIDEERLKNLAKKMRECYPEGKMPGTPYYYRCNTSEVVKSLKRFFIEYGNHSDEEIIDATKRFIASHNGDYRRLRLIKYFIIKNVVKKDEDGEGHVEQVSDLATFLENKEDKDVNTNDWTSRVV